MSGGSFNYAYRGIQDFSDELAEKIKDADDIPPDIMEVLKNIADESAMMARKMKAVEWYFSGDHGDDTLRGIISGWGDNPEGRLKSRGCGGNCQCNTRKN